MSTAAPRTRRPRRQRGLTESLLSIMLLLEACVLFFVVLNVAGAHIVSWPVALIGGAGFVVLMVIAALGLGKRWGVVLGCAIQVLLALTGILVVLMYVVAAIFIAIWIFCLYKGVTIDRRNAAIRAWMDENPGLDPRDYQS
ncbi:hypothetical protein GCM10025867_22620 [Frondihabitans sucicola]|uniref:DUF4233 domain-containing protein n=1 Tax=Frondihabitans sucicola TaxID=1268041 RepID=A0ABM8GNL6_9MICO|nr:DUF4233 domain-containing protein [Frondihabitans sucicola]BDZ50021.1 hypothetical protein GCM10025867_22620 [Frondihabitans sucicola]